MNYFPIYLDAAAMHPVLDIARDAFLCAPFGNPSSEHQTGREARNALEFAREKIATLLFAKPHHVYFCSTASEAAAWVAQSLYENGYGIEARPTEHHAILENIRHIPFTRPMQGMYLAEMYANNETGACPGYVRHSGYQGWICDATAAVGHVRVAFSEMPAGFLIADGLKFGSVPGAAILLAKHGAPLLPLIRGGGQERGMRSGTENVPAICAMAAALEWQTEHMEQNTEKLSKLSEIVQTELAKIDGILWNTPLNRPHLPHILNVSFDGVDAHALALLLSKDGVMVSPGAACSNGLNDPSHVIMAMFHDEQRARSAIRISMSHENTEEEIRIAAEKIKNAVAYLRSIG